MVWQKNTHNHSTEVKEILFKSLSVRIEKAPQKEGLIGSLRLLSLCGKSPLIGGIIFVCVIVANAPNNKKEYNCWYHKVCFPQ